MNSLSSVFSRWFRGALLTLGTIAMLAVPGGAPKAQLGSLNFIRDAEIENTISALAAPLFQAAGLAPSSVHIVLVQDKALNAFVAGGKNIFLFTGLILKSESPDTLRGVIAHETGHIQGGHLIRTRIAMEEASKLATITSILGVLAAIGSGRSDVGKAAIIGGSEVGKRTFLKHSRTQESAADQAALHLMDSTGRSSAPLMKFLEKLEDQELLSSQYQDPYLQTHPLSRERIETMRAHVEKSIHSAKVPDQQEQLRFERMIAKLYAFDKPFDTVMRRYPQSDRSFAARYSRAIAYYRKPDMNNALPIIDGLIAENPADPYLYELKGQMLFENARPAESMAAYRRALELAPSEELIARELGRVELEMGDPALLDDAIGHFRTALAASPQSAFTWRQLGIAYGRKGDMAMSSLALAEAELRKGRKSEADRLARRALKDLPKGSKAEFQALDIIEQAKAN